MRLPEDLFKARLVVDHIKKEGIAVSSKGLSEFAEVVEALLNEYTLRSLTKKPDVITIYPKIKRDQYWFCPMCGQIHCPGEEVEERHYIAFLKQAGITAKEVK